MTGLAPAVLAPPGAATAALVAAAPFALNGGMPMPGRTDDVAGPPPATPEELLRAVGVRRDLAAFRAVFDHFAPRVKAYAMKLGCDRATAEEIVQEVMVTVWRRAETFDAAQASASTWIFTIARNKRIDLVRRERRPSIDLDDPALVPAAPEAADRRIETAQAETRMRRAIEDLPEEQKDLLRLAYYEDKAHSAIAAERGLPLGTVKSRLRLALIRLRRALEGDDA